MKNFFKTMLALGLVVLISFTLTSCFGGENKTTTSSENSIKYKYEEVLEDKNASNFYVLNHDDNTLSPLLRDVNDFESIAEESSLTRYVTWDDGENKDTGYTKDQMIPKVGKRDAIMCMFENSKDLPSSITLEKYKDCGYTIGTNIGISQDGEAEIYTTSYEGTDFANKFPGTSDEVEILEKINNSNVPIKNIDPNMYFLLGLEKDKQYILSYYVGTTYYETKVKADLHIMQSQKITTLSNPYKKTKNGFFVLNLPTNLESGYYYVQDAGLIYYTGK